MEIPKKDSQVNSRSYEFLSSALLPALLIMLCLLSWLYNDTSDFGGSLIKLNMYIDNNGQRTSLGTTAIVSDELFVHVVRIKNGFLNAARMQGFVNLLAFVFTVLYLAFGSNTNKIRLIVPAIALTLLLSPIFVGSIN